MGQIVAVLLRRPLFEIMTLSLKLALLNFMLSIIAIERSNWLNRFFVKLNSVDLEKSSWLNYTFVQLTVVVRGTLGQDRQ